MCVILTPCLKYQTDWWRKMDKNVDVYIDDKKYMAQEGEPILNVARRNGIDIPALCYEESLGSYGACRLCIVDVKEGTKRGITTSCTLLCREGLKIETTTEEIKKHRKILFELYMAQAPESKEIRKLAAKYGVFETRFTKAVKKQDPLNNSCILCGLCVRVCNDVMGFGVINFIGRGYKTHINTPYLENSDICTGCKACLEVCPTKAIKIEDRINIRVMASWSNTEIELKQCSVCGKYYTPVVLHKKVDTLFYYRDKKEQLENMCPDCRRKYVTKRATLIINKEVGEYAK